MDSASVRKLNFRRTKELTCCQQENQQAVLLSPRKLSGLYPALPNGGKPKRKIVTEYWCYALHAAPRCWLEICILTRANALFTILHRNSFSAITPVCIFSPQRWGPHKKRCSSHQLRPLPLDRASPLAKLWLPEIMFMSSERLKECAGHR